MPLYDARAACVPFRVESASYRNILSSRKTPVIQLIVNGEARAFPAPITLGQLVAALDLAGKRIAIEKNGEIVPRSLHDATELADGDRLEIVVAVGGG